jgi:transcriptional regulator with XRE-family HTH domain
LPFCHVRLSGEKPSDPSLLQEPRTWGQHLRRQRILRGLRQRDLAVAHGISLAAIHNWERGHAEPEPRLLPRIVDFLGFCPIDPAEPLGSRLLRAREAQGLSRKRLAQLVRVDEATLWRWEEGKRIPAGQFDIVAQAILGVVPFDAARTRVRAVRRLTDRDLQEIRRLRQAGMFLREIGRRIGIAANTVRRRLLRR